MDAGGSTGAVASLRASGGSARTRSIWLSQLLLAAVVVVVALVVQTLAPAQFAYWTFSAGVAGVVVVTAATLTVPWARVPKRVVLIVPLLDILAIGLMQYGSGLYTSFLWVFPAVWISAYFSLAAMVAAGGLIGLIVLVTTVVSGGDETTAARLLIALLSLTFLGMSTHLTARQTRAFKTLLRRQASKLQETISRVSSQERRVSLVLDAIDTGIVRVSPTGTILAVNDTYIDLYGLDRESPQEPGTSVEYATLRGSPLPEAERPLARATAGELFDQLRVWLFDAAGGWHALSVSTRAVPPSAGEVASTLLLVHDITALIESERARERMAAVVSHELRNPLTAILGHAELLQEDATLPAHAQEQLRVISGASQRMQHLIDDILARDRAGAEAFQENSRLDLRRIVEASMESFAPTAHAGGVTVTLDAPGPVPLLGDAFRLRQVVDNLLSNAIKYTTRGGAVRIECVLDADTARLVVADSGVGISEADLPRIFEPYFRADTARDSGVSGTGLGMGITRSIVLAHGGILVVDSEQGVGTTLTVELPVGGPTP